MAWVGVGTPSARPNATTLPDSQGNSIRLPRIKSTAMEARMPAGAPIGSGLGVLNRNSMEIILERATVTIIIDAGVGTASDVTIAMELGAAGVLLNTGIAGARDPVRMARAMKHAVIAGREAYLAGRMAKKRYADPSSPLGGLI